MHTSLIAPAIEFPSTDAMEREGQLMLLQAQAMTVDSQEDYEAAANVLKDNLAFQDAIKAKLGPTVKATNEAHKEAVKLLKDALSRPELAEKTLRQNMGAWDTAQDDKRRAEEQRIQAELRAKEETKRQEEVKRLASQGKLEEAKVVHQAPIVVPAVVLPPKRKVEGIQPRKHWTFRLVDASKVNRKYLLPDETKIRILVNARGKDAEAMVGGIECYEFTDIAVRR